MTDLDAACLLKELGDYNMAGTLATPQMSRFDSIFQCAFDHAIRALEQKSGVENPDYVRNPNGSYSIRDKAEDGQDADPAAGPDPDPKVNKDRKFLIRNPSKSDKIPVYWRPGRTGYTSRLYEAGVYSETEINLITSRTSPDMALPVPIDPALTARMMASLNIYQESLSGRFETSKQDYDRELLNCELYRIMIRRLQDELLA